MYQYDSPSFSSDRDVCFAFLDLLTFNSDEVFSPFAGSHAESEINIQPLNNCINSTEVNLTLWGSEFRYNESEFKLRR